MSITFMGHELTQEWRDLYIWEIFFQSCPFKTFIELGTGHGGMSLFLALQCKQRGIVFHTFDNILSFNLEHGLPQMLNMKESYHGIDVFRDDQPTSVVATIQSTPAPHAIFFDNGDKPREWRMFAPHIAPGGYCIVHDWGTEFMESDIGGVSVEHILTEVSDARTPGGWQSMWFKRT
jgi:cephalosporin hydroxylase